MQTNLDEQEIEAAINKIAELEDKALTCQLDGRLDEALEFYQEVIEIAPQSAASYLNLATIALLQGNFDGAIICDEIALKLLPDSKEVYNHLGIAYQKANKIDKAREQFEKALAIDSKDSFTICNLASAREDDWDTAKVLYRRAFEELFVKFSELKEGEPLYFDDVSANAVALYANVCLETCDWGSYMQIKPLLSIIIHDQLADKLLTSVSPMLIPYIMYREQDIFAICRSHSQSRKIDQNKIFTSYPSSADKITIGYVIADNHNHLLNMTYAQLVANHDKDKFHVVIFALNKIPIEYRSILNSEADEFVDISDAPYYQAATMINDLNVHILIDTVGFNENARPEVLSFLPAPIQMSLAGYPASMACDYIKYKIFGSNRDLSKILGTESKVVLPSVDLAYSKIVDNQQKITREQVGLPDNKFVIACFADPIAITPELLRVCVKILLQSPNTVLWLYDFSPNYKALLFALCEENNIATNQVVFTKFQKNSPVILHHLADLYVDSTSVSQVEDCLTCLLNNIPVVTVRGENSFNRRTADILDSMGLSNLVAENLEELDSKIDNFVIDGGTIAAIKDKIQLAVDSSIVFNQSLYVKNLESAYEKVYQNYLNCNEQNEIIIS